MFVVRLMIAFGTFFTLAASSAHAGYMYTFTRTSGANLAGSFTTVTDPVDPSIVSSSDITAFSFTVTGTITETFNNSNAVISDADSNFPIHIDGSGNLLPNSVGGDPVLAIKSTVNGDELRLDVTTTPNPDNSGSYIVQWKDIPSGEGSTPSGSGFFTPFPTSSVPEPTSFILLASGAALAYGWRRRKPAPAT
jgi:hypothetical protein